MPLIEGKGGAASSRGRANANAAARHALNRWYRALAISSWF